MEDNLPWYIFPRFNSRSANWGWRKFKFHTAVKFTSFIITPHRPRNNKSIKFDTGRRDGRLIGKKIPSTGRTPIIKCAIPESANDRATSITDGGAQWPRFRFRNALSLLSRSASSIRLNLPVIVHRWETPHASFTRVDVDYFQKKELCQIFQQRIETHRWTLPISKELNQIYFS